MQITVKTPTGETITLDVLASDSIDSIKAKAIDIAGNPPEWAQQLYLSIGGRQLEGGKRLREYKNWEDATLELTAKIECQGDDSQPARASSRKRKYMQISIKKLAGETTDLDVSALDTVGSIKARIHGKADFPLDQLRLNYGDQQLDDDKTLRDYNIQEKSVLHAELATSRAHSDALKDTQHESSAASCQAAAPPVPSFGIGAAVVLRGLTKECMNGRRGKVAGSLADGRYPVRLHDSAKTLAVKPENLEQAITPVSAEPGGADEVLPPGTAVTVQNQFENPINGEHGIVRGYDAGRRHYIVLFHSGANAFLTRESLLVR